MSSVTKLSDLDELVLRVLDPAARAYVTEAVAAYQVGAFRAAIVTTWTAVVFDILDKLRQLDVTGDPNAKKLLQDFDRFRSTNDIENLLRTERGILEDAKKTFELLGENEHLDLKRLQEDRNRCAHPTMNADEEIYRPTAEQVRYHIDSAVRHLLQHPPVQGKAALDRVMRDVESLYFPKGLTEIDAAVQALNSGPLARPKESLVRNFVVVLLKKILLEPIKKVSEVSPHLLALLATRRMHPRAVDATLNEKLSDLMSNVKDNHTLRSVYLMSYMPDVWNYVTPALLARLRRYIQALPAEFTIALRQVLDSGELQEAARERIAHMTGAEMQDILPKLLAPTGNAQISILRPFLDRALVLYFDSANYDIANRTARGIVLPLLQQGLLTKDDCESIATAASANAQIGGSIALGEVLGNMGRVFPPGDYAPLLDRFGLTGKLPRVAHDSVVENEALDDNDPDTEDGTHDSANSLE